MMKDESLMTEEEKQAKARAITERYKKDKTFKQIVDSLVGLTIHFKFGISDIEDAVTIAGILVESQKKARSNPQ